MKINNKLTTVLKTVFVSKYQKPPNVHACKIKSQKLWIIQSMPANSIYGPTPPILFIEGAS